MSSEQTAAAASPARNGPRMVRPQLTRVDPTSYVLTIADTVDIRLTDRQARDLYQQLHDEFAPKARLLP